MCFEFGHIWSLPADRFVDLSNENITACLSSQKQYYAMVPWYSIAFKLIKFCTQHILMQKCILVFIICLVLDRQAGTCQCGVPCKSQHYSYGEKLLGTYCCLVLNMPPIVIGCLQCIILPSLYCCNIQIIVSNLLGFMPI